MLPVVVFLLGAASWASASARGEWDWVLIAVDVEVVGWPEASGEVTLTFALPRLCLHLESGKIVLVVPGKCTLRC